MQSLLRRTTPSTQLSWLFAPSPHKGGGTGFPNPATTRGGWSSDEEIYLARSYPTATEVPFISKLIGRTLGAVRRKAQRLGLRRPLRGRAANARLCIDAPPPAQSGITSSCHHAFSDYFSSIRRTSSGRLIWDGTAIDLLADLWKRLFSVTCIAQMLGLKRTAVSEAARRAGLPERAGLTLKHTIPQGSPQDVPVNDTIASQIIRKICKITGRPFFVRPRDVKKIHYSFLGKLFIARHHGTLESVGEYVSHAFNTDCLA